MQKGYLALELTASRIRYVHMERDGVKQRVVCCGELEHTLNIEAESALAQAIKSICAKERLSPDRLFVSLCSQENFIRQMLIPRMAAHEQEEAIKGEIEKFPVFSRNVFDFIYHSSNYSADQRNVVFAALEDKILKYLFNECQEAGIPFQHLEIVPLNMKELLALAGADTENQVLLIVNDHISYLAIVAGQRYRLIYQSGIGLESLMPSGGKAINENGVFSLLGELQRVLKSYLSQNRTEKLKKLWLVWDRNRAPEFDRLLVGQLGLDVEALSLEKIPSVDCGTGGPGNNPINALVALPSLIYLRRIRVDFFLDHFFRALHVTRYLVKSLLMASAVIILAGGLLGVQTYRYYSKTMEVRFEIASTQRRILELQDSVSDLYRQRDEYLAVRERLLAQANFVRNLNRVSWSQVLAVLAENMPQKVRLTSFKFSESGAVSFLGEALSIENIAELIRKVNGSNIVENGKFNFLTEKVIDPNKFDIYRFRMEEFQGALSPEALRQAVAANPQLSIPEDGSALEVLNALLEREDLYQVMARHPDQLGSLIARLESGKQLSPTDTRRLNRLLLEDNYPAETPKSPKLFSFGITARLKTGATGPVQEGL